MEMKKRSPDTRFTCTMSATVPTECGVAGSPTSAPSLMSVTPNLESPSRQSLSICL